MGCNVVCLIRVIYAYINYSIRILYRNCSSFLSRHYSKTGESIPNIMASYNTLNVVNNKTDDKTGFVRSYLPCNAFEKNKPILVASNACTHACTHTHTHQSDNSPYVFCII